MLELRLINTVDFNLEEHISGELHNCGFPYSEELTKLLLKNGKLIILLDGLDEITNTNLSYVIKEIKNLVDRYPDNRFITTCRVAAYNFGGFTNFTDATVAEFDDSQIERFIENWFSEYKDVRAKTSKRCWKLLQRQSYQAAKELAQTPLLLTLLCIVYDEYQDFPKRRHALYGEALDVLLRKWAAEKRIQHNPIYQELSIELELELLSEIAYTSFADNQLFFSKDMLLEQIREFLVDSIGAPRYLDSEKVLQEIEVQQGILVERAREIYSFSHLTFQEHLTAKFIADNRKTNTLVKYHINDSRWREVFLLVAGLLPGKRGTEDLLLLVEKEVLSKYDSAEVNAVCEILRPIKHLETRIHEIETLYSLKKTYLRFSDKLDILVKFCSLRECLNGDHGFFERMLDAVDNLARLKEIVLYHDGYGIQERLGDCINLIEQAILNLPNSKIEALFILLDCFQSISSDGLPRMFYSDNENKEFYETLTDIKFDFWSEFVDKLKTQPKSVSGLHNYFNAVELIFRSQEASARISHHSWSKLLSRLPSNLVEYLSEVSEANLDLSE